MKQFLSISLLLITCNSAYAGSKIDSIIFYLPDVAMEERIEVKKFSAYVAELGEIFNTHFSSTDSNAGIAIVVALRKNEKTFWINTAEGDKSKLDIEKLAASIKALPSPRIENGVVPFALSVQVGNSKYVLENMPIIPEWGEFLDGKTEVSVAIGKAWDKRAEQRANRP